MHVFNVTSGILLTGKQDCLLFLFSLLTLELPPPPHTLAFPPAGERIQECHLSLLPLWILPGRWQNELACEVLRSFSNPLFSFNEAVLDRWRFGDSKGPHVDSFFFVPPLDLRNRNLLLYTLFHLLSPL